MGGEMILDGKRPPKPEPMAPLRLFDIHPEPVVMEIDLAEWLEADAWPQTVPMDLSEVKSG